MYQIVKYNVFVDLAQLRVILTEFNLWLKLGIHKFAKKLSRVNRSDDFMSITTLQFLLHLCKLLLKSKGLLIASKLWKSSFKFKAVSNSNPIYIRFSSILNNCSSLSDLHNCQMLLHVTTLINLPAEVDISRTHQNRNYTLSIKFNMIHLKCLV